MYYEPTGAWSVVRIEMLLWTIIWECPCLARGQKPSTNSILGMVAALEGIVWLSQLMLWKYLCIFYICIIGIALLYGKYPSSSTLSRKANKYLEHVAKCLEFVYVEFMSSVSDFGLCQSRFVVEDNWRRDNGMVWWGECRRIRLRCRCLWSCVRVAREGVVSNPSRCYPEYPVHKS